MSYLSLSLYRLSYQVMASVHHDFPSTCTQQKNEHYIKYVVPWQVTFFWLNDVAFVFQTNVGWHQVRDIPGLEICGAHFLRDMSDQSYLCLNRRCHSALNFSLPSSNAGT